MVLTHTLDRGVLVVTLHGDVVISDRATVSQQLAEVVRSHLPRAVVIELRTSVISAAALSAVLRAHRQCGQAGMTLSAVATVASARRPARRATPVSAPRSPAASTPPIPPSHSLQPGTWKKRPQRGCQHPDHARTLALTWAKSRTL
ncbi:STAS domain-containing protein [Streptomyces sp. 5K101]|uniref:STAS domain-containing protein n=1 Tax=Streptomyces sp. 5K101 TaxID=3390037 RepID=UPI0039754B53